MKRMAVLKPANPAHESGAVLIVGLMLLLVLSMLGVTAMRNALLEETMTGNVQDYSIALQAAEAALRDGELLLEQSAPPNPGDVDDDDGDGGDDDGDGGDDDGDDDDGDEERNGRNGFYPPASPTDPPRWTTINWQSDSAVRVYEGFKDAPGSLSGATARYFIEELPPAISPGESLSADTPLDRSRFYRITARGTGAGGRTVAIVQSTYKR